MNTNNSNILDQVRNAFRNPLALALSVPPAAFLPIAVFMIAHHEIVNESNGWLKAAKIVAVLGGLVFSAKSVFHWASLMFQDRVKALGFVALMETVMILSSNQVIAFCALGLLVSINAVAAAANTAVLDTRAKNRRKGAKKAVKTRATARPALKAA